MPASIDLRFLLNLAAPLAAVGCLVGAGYLGMSWRDEGRLRDANEAARRGDFRAAVVEARSISRAPTRTRALAVEAFALLELGDLDAALRAFERAAGAAPNDAQIRRGWGTALLRTGQRAQAERQLARALALNPGIALPSGFGR